MKFYLGCSLLICSFLSTVHAEESPQLSKDSYANTALPQLTADEYANAITNEPVMDIYAHIAARDEQEQTEDMQEESGLSSSFGYELDAYYTSLSWVLGFGQQEIPVVSNLAELGIYKKLIKDSLTPDFIILEASINPLPVLGVYLREKQENIYNKGNSYGESNIIESITSGFEDPFALSLFAGRIVRFAAPEGMGNQGNNMGYVGYLLSTGTKHIQHNVLIPDSWVEAEWKIKGKRETDAQSLSWSVRGGAKFHSNKEISDTVMLGIRRDRIDFTKNGDDFMRDFGFEYRLDMLQTNLKPSRQLFIVDKHWPLDHGKLAVSLGLGVIWQGQERYLGVLAETQQAWSIVFRPNIQF